MSSYQPLYVHFTGKDSSGNIVTDQEVKEIIKDGINIYKKPYRLNITGTGIDTTKTVAYEQYYGSDKYYHNNDNVPYGTRLVVAPVSNKTTGSGYTFTNKEIIVNDENASDGTILNPETSSYISATKCQINANIVGVPIGRIIKIIKDAGVESVTIERTYLGNNGYGQLGFLNSDDYVYYGDIIRMTFKLNKGKDLSSCTITGTSKYHYVKTGVYDISIYDTDIEVNIVTESSTYDLKVTPLLKTASGSTKLGNGGNHRVICYSTKIYDGEKGEYVSQPAKVIRETETFDYFIIRKAKYGDIFEISEYDQVEDDVYNGEVYIYSTMKYHCYDNSNMICCDDAIDQKFNIYFEYKRIPLTIYKNNAISTYLVRRKSSLQGNSLTTYLSTGDYVCYGDELEASALEKDACSLGTFDSYWYCGKSGGSSTGSDDFSDIYLKAVGTFNPLTLYVKLNGQAITGDSNKVVQIYDSQTGSAYSPHTGDSTVFYTSLTKTVHYLDSYFFTISSFDTQNFDLYCNETMLDTCSYQYKCTSNTTQSLTFTTKAKKYLLTYSFNTQPHLKNLIVTRTESPYESASIGEIYSGTEIYYGDVLTFNVTPENGYKINGTVPTGSVTVKSDLNYDFTTTIIDYIIRVSYPTDIIASMKDYSYDGGSHPMYKDTDYIFNYGKTFYFGANFLSADLAKAYTVRPNGTFSMITTVTGNSTYAFACDLDFYTLSSYFDSGISSVSQSVSSSSYGSSGSKSVTTSGGSNSYYYNDIITVTANAKTGYNIINYVDDVSGVTTTVCDNNAGDSKNSYSHSVTIDKSRSYHYTSALKKFTITFSKGTGVETLVVKKNGVEITSGSSITYGDSITVSSSAADGYSLNPYTTGYIVSGNINFSITAILHSYTFSPTTNGTLTLLGSIIYNRTSSPLKNASLGTIVTGVPVYYGDVIAVSYTYNDPTAGPNITTISSNCNSTITISDVSTTYKPSFSAEFKRYKLTTTLTSGLTKVVYAIKSKCYADDPRPSTFNCTYTTSSYQELYYGDEITSVTLTLSTGYRCTDSAMTAGFTITSNVTKNFVEKISNLYPLKVYSVNCVYIVSYNGRTSTTGGNQTYDIPYGSTYTIKPISVSSGYTLLTWDLQETYTYTMGTSGFSIKFQCYKNVTWSISTPSIYYGHYTASFGAYTKGATGTFPSTYSNIISATLSLVPSTTIGWMYVGTDYTASKYNTIYSCGTLGNYGTRVMGSTNLMTNSQSKLNTITSPTTLSVTGQIEKNGSGATVVLTIVYKQYDS